MITWKIPSLLAEAEIEQPLNDNRLDDVEPLVETEMNLVEVETSLAKDRNSEHPVAEPGIPEQVEPRIDSIDVQSQITKSDKRDDVEPVGRINDAATAGKLFSSYYVSYRWEDFGFDQLSNLEWSKVEVTLV